MHVNKGYVTVIVTGIFSYRELVSRDKTLPNIVSVPWLQAQTTVTL